MRVSENRTSWSLKTPLAWEHFDRVHEVVWVTVSYPYTDYMCKEALRQYTLDLSLGETSYTSRNFLKNNLICLPSSAECARRVIYAQPLLMCHFLVQTKLQSLTKRELQSTSLKELLTSSEIHAKQLIFRSIANKSLINTQCGYYDYKLMWYLKNSPGKTNSCFQVHQYCNSSAYSPQASRDKTVNRKIFSLFNLNRKVLRSVNK